MNMSDGKRSPMAPKKKQAAANSHEKAKNQ